MLSNRAGIRGRRSGNSERVQKALDWALLNLAVAQITTKRPKAG